MDGVAAPARARLCEGEGVKLRPGNYRNYLYKYTHTRIYMYKTPI